MPVTVDLSVQVVLVVALADSVADVGQVTVKPVLGLAEAVSVTLPTKLLILVRPTTVVPDPPRFKLAGIDPIEKSETTYVTLPKRDKAPLVPVTVTT